MNVDFIIVGLGLAGTLLAHELIQSGKSVMVFDDPAAPKASSVTAGIINPVVFRRMTKIWLVDDREILELKIPELNMNEIISDEVFVAPVGKDLYKVGATFTWDTLNWETTDFAREELLAKFKKITPVIPETISQKAGIRPTMHDRKPVIGFHPDYPSIGIFNGLGSKGVLLGPYFARQLADYLVETSDFIHPEADVKRYFP